MRLVSLWQQMLLHIAEREDYEGEDAEYLRLQALQLLLRTQVQAIRKLWDLPEVYEVSAASKFLGYGFLGPRGAKLIYPR